MSELLFRFIAYCFFGIFMEVLVSSITTISREGWNSESKKMIGSVSIFMSLIYGPLLLFAFEPLMVFISPLNTWIQFLIYGVIFTLIEFLSGLLLDKVFKIKLWDYSQLPDSLWGYTHLDLFWKWGFCGLLIANYSAYIQHLQYIK